MVLVGFIVRVLYIVLAHSYKFRTTDANFSFGWEIGRIAYSLANGSRLQLALRWRHRPFRLDCARLPVDRLAGLSRLRQLHARRLVRAADL